MVDPETYISEGLKIIKNLAAKGELSSALSACQELLKVNPYHPKVQKQLKKIQEIILKKNKKKVDEDIDATMHLWKEGRFEDLMKIYTRLYQYAPMYPRLHDLIEKTNEKLTQQQKTQRADFVGKALEAIKGLINGGQLADAVQACNELLTVDPINAEAKGLLQQARDRIIEQKLKENQRIVEGSDFQRALEFYNTLLAIDPNNQQVNALVKRAGEHLAAQKKLASRIHLNESTSRMKDLFENTDYEKAIQSCEEILRLDPGNLTAKIFKRKSQRMIEYEIGQMEAKRIKASFALLRLEYQKNPQGFVRI